MARIRTIKPEFWRHEELSELPEATHLLAAALLNYADDHGYFNANPALIKAECSPLREPSVSIHESLTHLSSIGYIQLGKCPNGRRIGRVVAFDKHQRVNRPSESKFADVSITWDAEKPLTEYSVSAHGVLTSGTGNREQGTGKGESTPRKRGSTATRIPDDFELTPERRQAAVAERVDADREYVRFVDYWRAAPGTKGRKADWDATWRNWCRRAADTQPRRETQGGRRKGRAELAWDEFAAAHGLDGDSAVLADLDIGPERPNGRLGAGTGWPDAATGDARDSDTLDLERGLPSVAGEVPRNLHRLPRA